MNWLADNWGALALGSVFGGIVIAATWAAVGIRASIRADIALDAADGFFSLPQHPHQHPHRNSAEGTRGVGVNQVHAHRNQPILGTDHV